LGAGVTHREILFIAVRTPALPTSESDIRYLETVTCGISSHLNGGYKVIAVEWMLKEEGMMMNQQQKINIKGY